MPYVASGPRQRFVFATCNAGWGGSEELWSATAAILATEGHRVTAFVGSLDKTEPRLQELRRLSCSIKGLWGFSGFRRTLIVQIVRRAMRLPALAVQAAHLGLNVLLTRPDLVVISQGQNFEGLALSWACRIAHAPYVLIAQRATDYYWFPDNVLPHLRAMYGNALWSFFVSAHNWKLTEEQIGIRLPRASIVRNPFNTSWTLRDDWPQMENGVRLACIARLFPAEKGQDLVLRVLARDKWRSRPVHVTFFGDGPQAKTLRRMAEMLALTSVEFAGFVRDISKIWDNYHGLILASRCEGLPLVIVEAMLCGRVTIATDVGGNREVIDDGETGFLAAAPTEDALDKAMEYAWQERARWRLIGQTAAIRIRTLVPSDPAKAFAGNLKKLTDQPKSG